VCILNTCNWKCLCTCLKIFHYGNNLGPLHTANTESFWNTCLELVPFFIKYRINLKILKYLSTSETFFHYIDLFTFQKEWVIVEIISIYFMLET